MPIEDHCNYDPSAPDSRHWYSLRMDVPHAELHTIHNWLVKNDRSTKHILGLELDCKNSKNKEHLQALIYITKDTAQDIRKNLCRQKYKLKGRATKNQPSQYSCSPARDWRVLGCYVQKDQHPDNIFYNISELELLDMKHMYLRPEDKIQVHIDNYLKRYKTAWKNQIGIFEPGYSPEDPQTTKYQLRPLWIYSNVLKELRKDDTFKLSLTSIKFKNLMISLFFKNDLISPEQLANDHLSRFYRV